MSLYRVVDATETTWYRSRAHNGFYESRESAERAIKQLRTDKFTYDKETKRYVKVGEYGWKVQETEVQWNDIA